MTDLITRLDRIYSKAEEYPMFKCEYDYADEFLDAWPEIREELITLREALNYSWELVEEAFYNNTVLMVRRDRFLSTYFDENGLKPYVQSTKDQAIKVLELAVLGIIDSEDALEIAANLKIGQGINWSKVSESSRTLVEEILYANK